MLPIMATLTLLNDYSCTGASLSGIQNWGFNLTADRIGFAKHVDIREDRKESVVRLLRDAEEREKLTLERQAASSTKPAQHAQTAPTQTGASELGHGDEIRRPPLRELFSSDNTRYTKESDNEPLEQLEPANSPSPSDPPRPNGAAPTSLSAGPGNGTKQFSYPLIPQQRVSSAVSTWSNIESTSRTGHPSGVLTPFSYSATPPAATMTQAKIVLALNPEEISSSSTSTNYHDTRKTWNSALADRSTVSMTQTSLESVQEDQRMDSTGQDRLPGPDSSPSRLKTAPYWPWSSRLQTTDTLSLETLEELVKERRRGGFSLLPGPGSSSWHLADVESMIHAHRQAGITHVGLAEAGYYPIQPPEDRHVSSSNTTIMDNPFNGPLDSGPSYNRAAEINAESRYLGSPPPPTRPPPALPPDAVPTVLAGLLPKGAERFANGPNGIFEMP
jgi:hypothetical protein